MSGHLHAGRSPHSTPRDYSKTPLNVYWEMTQACALACRHCRAEAVPMAHPDELGTAEGMDLLRQIAEFGDPLPQLILTGGDPLARADLNSYTPRSRTLAVIDRYLGRRSVLLHERGHALAAPLADALANRLSYSADSARVRQYPMSFLAQVYVTFAAPMKDESKPDDDPPRRRDQRRRTLGAVR
ncbi:MAG: hypothetical protein SGI92_22920 [Bryobacteraceae bacterium]|nr:hypothetical protein [Bryobacteraceae bacterium]